MKCISPVQNKEELPNLLFQLGRLKISFIFLENTFFVVEKYKLKKKVKISNLVADPSHLSHQKSISTFSIASLISWSSSLPDCSLCCSSPIGRYLISPLISYVLMKTGGRNVVVIVVFVNGSTVAEVFSFGAAHAINCDCCLINCFYIYKFI